MCEEKVVKEIVSTRYVFSFVSLSAGQRKKLWTNFVEFFADLKCVTGEKRLDVGANLGPGWSSRNFKRNFCCCGIIWPYCKNVTSSFVSNDYSLEPVSKMTYTVSSGT